jgi:hypothetical protein
MTSRRANALTEMCGAAKHKRVKLSVNAESRKVASTVFRKNVSAHRQCLSPANRRHSPTTPKYLKAVTHLRARSPARRRSMVGLPFVDELIELWIGALSSAR